MKICIADGHSKGSPGASGLLDEFTCANAYVMQLASALSNAGYEVVSVLDGPGNSNAELAEKVRIANDSGADLFIDVHFNSGGGTGTECYYWHNSASGKALAEKMSANVATALGLRNRGAKANNSFYVLRNTTMPAVLLETLFVDTQQDADAWNRTSWKRLTDAVVDAIRGVDYVPGNESTPPANNETQKSVLENSEYRITVERK